MESAPSRPPRGGGLIGKPTGSHLGTLRQRRSLTARHTEPLRRLREDPGLLLFARGNALICAVNLAEEPAGLPAHTEVLLAGGPLDAEGTTPGHGGVAGRLKRYGT
ncbi:hypothetical protein ACFWM7_32830, partial [Streptomyces sp. NPDC058375]